MATNWTIFLFGGFSGASFLYMLQALDQGYVYTPIGAGLVALASIAYSWWLMRRMKQRDAQRPQ